MMTGHPVLSVCLLAYNHERTIVQAVRGALAQQTNFPVEIVIGEDASTDRTLVLLRELAAEHPGRLTLLANPRNLGAAGNFARILAACRGEFIAMLEGDDFWHHPRKLERQVGLLRQDPSVSLCCHDVDVVSGDDARPLRRYCIPKPAALSTGADLLRRNFVSTCSVVLRASALPSSLPREIASLRMQDWPTWLHAARHGNIAFIDECWAAYRVHSAGLWSGLSDLQQQAHALAFYRAVRPTLPAAWRRAAGEGEKTILAAHIEGLVRAGHWPKARPLVWRYLLLAPGRFRPPPGRGRLFMRVLAGRPSAVMRTFPEGAA